MLTAGAVITIAVLARTSADDGGGNNPPTPSGPAAGSRPATGGDSPSGTAPVTATFTFNALGGTASQYVSVYAGPGTSATDRQQTGTYPAGEHATAVCKATGRTITSSTEAGEQPRTSDEWVGIETAAGQTWFATLTYGDIATADYDGLPTCPTP